MASIMTAGQEIFCFLEPESFIPKGLADNKIS
jgi:hypothetical protein